MTILMFLEFSGKNIAVDIQSAFKCLDRFNWEPRQFAKFAKKRTDNMRTI